MDANEVGSSVFSVDLKYSIQIFAGVERLVSAALQQCWEGARLDVLAPGGAVTASGLRVVDRRVVVGVLAAED